VSARTAIVQILEKYRKTNGFLKNLIDEGIERSGITDSRDIALVSAVCIGVVRNTGLLDFYIDRYSSGTKAEPVVRTILRSGAYQLVFMDRLPDHAVVNETVKLCQPFKAPRAKGYVNAVMHRIAENKGSLPELPGKGSAEYLARRYSHPLWLAEYMIGLKGYDFTESFFKANNTEPATGIVINTLKITVEDYARLLDEAGVEHSRPGYPKTMLTVGTGRVSALPGYSEGLFFVQDPAAHSPADIAGLKPGYRVADVCASPGGKSFSAAMAMKGTGEIRSFDVNEKKTAVIASGAERLGIGMITVEAADAGINKPEMNDSFDVVIADVPCSGIGVIRKKPEIRSKKKEEISNLPAIQRRIIGNAARYVKPGGVLVYSTCTVLTEENEAVVKAFLAENENYGLEGFTLGSRQVPEGMYTFWPNTDDTDGFFAAKLRRKQ